MVKDINPGSNASDPSRFLNVSGTLFFVAFESTHGFELWRSDGTAAGTVLVDDIRPGPVGSTISGLTNVSGTLFFAADDGVHGKQLWESNGVAAGTVMVADISPAGKSSSPAYLTNVNGSLFFSANDGTHGVELWQSNGTAAGTALVMDIRPEAIHDAGDHHIVIGRVHDLDLTGTGHPLLFFRGGYGTRSGRSHSQPVMPISSNSSSSSIGCGPTWKGWPTGLEPK